jgi:hypothetical protein
MEKMMSWSQIAIRTVLPYNLPPSQSPHSGIYHLKDVLLTSGIHQRLCQNLISNPLIHEIDYFNVHVKNCSISQVFNDCLNVVNYNKKIRDFKFAYALSLSGPPFVTLNDENADFLVSSLENLKLTHLTSLDLTNNQFGDEALYKVVKAILKCPSIELANLKGHNASQPIHKYAIKLIINNVGPQKEIRLGMPNDI